jgi:hypothetical protein
LSSSVCICVQLWLKIFALVFLATWLLGYLASLPSPPAFIRAPPAAATSPPRWPPGPFPIPPGRVAGGADSSTFRLGHRLGYTGMREER